MYETFYLASVTIGLLSLVFAIGFYRYHNEVPVFAGMAFFTWTIVALESSTLTVIDETGTLHTVGSGSMQLLAAGLALVSLVAVIGSATGRWPTHDHP